MLRHVYDVFPTHMGWQRKGLKNDGAETATFVNVETASPVDMASAPFVDVVAGHKEMPHEGKDFLVI